MKQRVKTGVAIFVAVCLLLRFSYIGWVMNGAVAFLCVLGIYELYDAVGLSKNKWLLGISVVLALAVAGIPIRHGTWLLGVLLPTMMILFAVVMARIGKMPGFRPWQMVLLAGAVVICFASMKLIRLRPNGLIELTLGIFVCMITDSCAYFVGRSLGRHKLAPKVSPNKTVEGSVGGTVLATLVLLTACWLLETLGGPRVHYGPMTAYLLVASLVGQYGDLCMSAVKRVLGIKDYGNLLPGHGGILDRCDSLMLVLPFTYLFCTVVGPIFG